MSTHISSYALYKSRTWCFILCNQQHFFFFFEIAACLSACYDFKCGLGFGLVPDHALYIDIHFVYLINDLNFQQFVLLTI